MPTSKVMTHLRVATALTALASILSACGTAPRLGKFYDGAEQPPAQLATLVHLDSYSAERNLVSYDWIARVTAVDGKALGGYTRVQVAPGRHTVTLSCEVNPRHTGYKNTSKILEVDVQAGKTYYPAGHMRETARTTSRVPGALPMSTMPESKSYGDCTPFLRDTKAP